MRKRVCLPFLLSLQVLPSISSRQKRQLNFESDSTENDQRPTSKVFFGLTNIFGSGFGGIVGSNGNGDTCSCSTGSDLEDRLPAPRVGQSCNCATSVEFGGDCKGRDPGDRWENRKWKVYNIIFEGFLVADAVGLGMGSSHFQRGERGKLQTLEMWEKKHKREFSIWGVWQLLWQEEM